MQGENAYPWELEVSISGRQRPSPAQLRHGYPWLSLAMLSYPSPRTAAAGSQDQIPSKLATWQRCRCTHTWRRLAGQALHPPPASALWNQAHLNIGYITSAPTPSNLQEDFGIRWYGLAYLAGFVAWWLLRLWSRRNQLPLDYQSITDAVFYIAISMMIGGRVGYCLFYYEDNGVGAPWALLQDPMAIIRVWDGGMASHGGVAGMFLGTWLFCRKRRFPSSCSGTPSPPPLPLGWLTV